MNVHFLLFISSPLILRRNIVYEGSSMKNSHFSIRIDHPCHEDWEGMAAVSSGRHCALCRKTVIDFTETSDREIFSFFTANPGHICGRFTEDQLNRAMSLPPAGTRKGSFPKLTALFLLIPSLWTNTGAQILPKVAVEATPSTSKGYKKIKLKGMIRDEISQKPLCGMEIRIEGFGSRYCNTKGEFFFVFPDSLMNKEIIVSAYYTSTSSEELSRTAIVPQTVVLDSYSPTVTLKRMPVNELEEVTIAGHTMRTGRVSRINLGATQMYVEPPRIFKRPSIWERIKNIFH